MVHKPFSAETLPITNSFHWSAVDIVAGDEAYDPYEFSSSSGDEYEEDMQVSSSTTSTTRAVKLRKLMDTEIDEVAERALQSMAQSGAEKRNVWLAYLNLEHVHGDDRSIFNLLSRAASHNDPEEMYLAFVGMITQSPPARPELAEKAFATMLKKFPQNAAMWRAYLSYQLDQLALGQGQDLQEAGPAGQAASIKKRRGYEDTLARALSVLPARTHVPLLSGLASRQFKAGDVHAARNVLDAILSKYPKQVDQWHVYIDLEIHHGEIERARQLLEKATAIKHSSKSMKGLLKKYMTFETDHGTTQTKEHVKQIAVDYLNSKET